MPKNQSALRGIVKWYSIKMGYGFITAENGDDYYVHQSVILMPGFRKLRRNQEVKFTPFTDASGRLTALNVEN